MLAGSQGFNLEGATVVKDICKTGNSQKNIRFSEKILARVVTSVTRTYWGRQLGRPSRQLPLERTTNGRHMVRTYDFGCRNMFVPNDIRCRNMVVTDDFRCRNMVVTDDIGCRNMVVSYDFRGSNMVVTYDFGGSMTLEVVTWS